MEVLDIALPENAATMQLPDVYLTNYWRLAENRIFYLDTEIDESTLELQRSIININIQDKDIAPEDRVPIKIYIDSLGGNIDETFTLCSTIMMSKTPVITINVGCAYSGAGLIFMAGHKRYTFPYAQVLIHSGSGSISGTFEQTEQTQKNYKKQVDKMGEYIIGRTKISSALLKKNKSKEWYLDAQEQIDLGIATSIVENLDDII